ncbi:Fe-only nitrogenase accessory AnfO family protein [Pelosinus sp. sgz500959]|uniref:Fe-only nitrogenase accessory AnfO family protein n=1 Tax=Pelosinus sp. sgz500959 TaxID=3242472 RepID=UPI00366C0AAF
MAPDIAVCMNENGVTSSFYDGSLLVIYQKVQGQWTISREQKISLEQKGGMAGLRRQMAEIGLFLGQCKIVVGASIVGMPYFELEKMQCSIWEFEGEPLSFLDYVLGQEEEKLAASKLPKSEIIPVPVERENGDYYISIKEVQETGGGITSKQVLMGFLQQGQFYSLEVLCNHIPPWLEIQLQSGPLVGRIDKKSPTETHVYITKRGCAQ